MKIPQLLYIICVALFPSMVQGAPFASEDFGASAMALHGTNGGTGWSGAWDVQNAKPGYAIDNVNPLIYGNLLATNGYAVGGDLFTRSGRKLSVASFGEVAVTGGGAIGAPGSELWIGFLARRDGDDGWSISTHLNGTIWANSSPRFSVRSVSGEWAIVALDNIAGAARSGIATTIGETFLLVLRVRFGEPDVIDLYVNPTDLGASAPSSPNATISVAGADLSFNRITWYPGALVNKGSLDELRFGATFADVTPLDPNPDALPEIIISAPADKGSFVQGQIITFKAVATDAEDGDLSNGIVWSSDKAGNLGTGANLMVNSGDLAIGTHVITATATDSAARAGHARIELSVKANTGLTILTTALPHAIVGQPYSYILEAFGGALPYTWSTANGTTLPAGFQLDAITGQLSGQSQVLFTHDVDFRVIDALGATSTQLLSMSGAPPPSSGPVVYTPVLPPIVIGVPYDFTLSTDGTAVTFLVKNGSLPTGLVLDAASGRIHGTVPTTVTGTIRSFEIWAGNAQFDSAKPSYDQVNNTYRTATLYGLRLINRAKPAPFVRVFLAAGQSNMGGGGASGAASGTIYEAPLNDVWYSTGAPAEGQNRHVADWIAMGNNPLSSGAGCELSFARKVADAFPLDQIAVIKTAVGATGIPYWLPGSAGYETLEEEILLARQRLEAQISTGEISGYRFEGLIWMQGENEANALPNAGADQYGSSLSLLVSSIEGATGDSPLYVVIGRIDAKLDPALGGPSSINLQSLAIVRAAEVDWSNARSWADWVDTDDLPHSDGFHYNGAGLITLGERFGDAIINLHGGPLTELNFSTWQSRLSGNNPASEPSDDPDGDGRPNALEFYTGSNPLAPDNGPVQVFEVSGSGPSWTGRIVVPKSPHRSGVVLSVETSNTLQPNSWTAANAAVSESAADPDTGQTESILTFPVLETPGFFRLRLDQAGN